MHIALGVRARSCIRHVSLNGHHDTFYPPAAADSRVMEMPDTGFRSFELVTGTRRP